MCYNTVYDRNTWEIKDAAGRAGRLEKKWSKQIQGSLGAMSIKIPSSFSIAILAFGAMFLFVFSVPSPSFAGADSYSDNTGETPPVKEIFRPYGDGASDATQHDKEKKKLQVLKPTPQPPVGVPDQGFNVPSNFKQDKAFEKKWEEPDPFVREDLQRKQFPITPGNIKETEQMFLESNRAVHFPPPHTLRNRIIRIGVHPGAPIPVVRVTEGYSTTISFVDVQGHPWPLASWHIGNSREFMVSVPGIDSKGKPIVGTGLSTNTMLVEAGIPYASTNITVLLQGEDFPITFIVEEVRDKTDIHVSASVLAFGPNSDKPVLARDSVVSQADAAPGILDDFLAGIPPAGAKPMKVKDDLSGDAEAWTYHGEIYLRSTMRVLYPMPEEYRDGEGNIHIFKLMPLNAVGMTDNEGNIHTVMLDGIDYEAMKTVPGNSGN